MSSGQNPQWKLKIVVLLIAIVILLSPQLIRLSLGETHYSSEETYYHARMAEQIRDEGEANIDLLQNEMYGFSLFHYILGKSGISVDFLATFLPLILGVISLILFFLINKIIVLTEEEQTYSMMMLVITPSFMYSFSTLYPDALAAVLILFGALFYLRSSYVSLIFFAPVFLLSPVQGALLFIGVVSHSLITGNKRMFTYFVAMNAVVLSIFTIFLGFNPLPYFRLVESSPIDLFTVFGSLNGYSVILLGLFIIGIFASWNRSLNRIGLNLFIIFSFIVSAFYPASRILVTFAVAIVSGIAIHDITTRKWNLDLIKNITILLIVCSLVFSLIVFVRSDLTRISKDKVDAMSFLSTTEQGEIILTTERNGFLVEAIANRPVFLDGNSYMIDDYDEKRQIADMIYYSRDLEELEMILKSYNITHLLVDKQMREGEVWNSRDEGILFLFQYSKKFVKLFDNDEMQIYRYIESN